MKLSKKIKQGFVFSVIIIVVSSIILLTIAQKSTDSTGGGIGMFFYILFLLGTGVILGTLFLLLDLLKIKQISRSIIFNFIATLNIVLGFAGTISAFVLQYEKITDLIPFTISLIIGLVMFYKID